MFPCSDIGFDGIDLLVHFFLWQIFLLLGNIELRLAVIQHQHSVHIVEAIAVFLCDLLGYLSDAALTIAVGGDGKGVIRFDL
jgi:hypothetical protein